MDRKILHLSVLVFIIVFCLGGIGRAAENKTLPNLNRAFLDCLWDKEASKQWEPRDGDNGNAIGPYQIWKVYWQDAVEFDKSIGGTYQDCRNKAYAEKVIKAYMRRYAPTNASYEVMARIHNGGPRGHRKAATVKYWRSPAFAPLRDK